MVKTIDKSPCIKNAKIVLVLFFLSAFFELKAQTVQSTNDTISLRSLLKKIENESKEGGHHSRKSAFTKEDSIELNTLIRKISSGKSPEILKYADLARAYRDYFSLSNQIRTLALEKNFLGRLNGLIDLTKEKNLTELDGKLYYLRGQYFSKFKHDFQKAITDNQLSIEFAATAKDTVTLVNAYNGIGLNYAELGVSDKAIEFFHKSLKLQKLPDQKYTTQITISDLYRKIHRYDKSLLYLKEAERISKENKFESTYLLNIYLELASVYIAQKDFAAASEQIKKAENIDSPIFTGRIHYTKGLWYFYQNDFGSAIAEFEKSLDFQKKNKFSNRDTKLYNALGNAYFKLDSVHRSAGKSVEIPRTVYESQNLLQTSKSYFLKSYELLPRTQIKENKRKVYESLKKIYLTEGNYQKAFEMAELERNMADSINNFEVRAKFIEKELQYEYELKREADSLRSENEKLLTKAQIERKKAENRLLYLGLLVLGLILTMAFFRFKYQQNEKQVEIEKKNTLIASKEKEILSAELDFLKAQINPHFLFNVINSIYFKIDKSNNDARDTLSGFSDILRYQLYECNQPKVPIENEIKYLREYVRLQLMRKAKNTELHLHIAESVSGFALSPLLLIPFVENAFKYLSHHKNSPNTIDISLERNADLFTFTLVNTYIPQAIKDSDSPGGIGISNVKRRLNLLYPEKHALKITENGERYSVVLTLTIEGDGS